MPLSLISRLWLPIVCLFWCLNVSAQGPNESADTQLRTLIDQAWQWELEIDPFVATEVGVQVGQDRLPDDRPETQVTNDQQRAKFLERLKAIPFEQLSVSSRTDYQVFQLRLSNQRNEYRFGNHLMPISNRAGYHVTFPELPTTMRLETEMDYQNYVARLNDFHRYSKEQLHWMREGIQQGKTMPAIILRGAADQIRAQIVDKPTDSLLYGPFTKPRPTVIPESQWLALSEAAEQAIESSVLPAYRELLTFMESEYLPACRGSISASALPDGRNFYRYRVKNFTTLDLSPDEIHSIGMREVERIKSEMQQVMKRTGFEGSFNEFVEKLRTDKQHYAQTPEELVSYAATLCKRIDGQLPTLFRKLPRTPYGIKEIPAFVAPQTTSAYYWPPAGDGTRAGFYFLNTYNLSARPKYEMEALTMHEAVPGHHLQIALQQELTDLHAIRRFAQFTAYVEGWALYSERLGLEMGFYTDPYQEFGRLSMEAWRACRLVVDTGIHWMGWSREQAIEFMKANTGLAEHNIVSEVDRYIGWPGQALGYKMGQLKIIELRELAERELGNKFDIRSFHDVVLEQGAVPLSVLEDNVRHWIDASK